MSVGVLHVCDKFGVKGSSIHGVSRLFSWWFPRYDPARFRVSLCGIKGPEPATVWLDSLGIPVHHLGRGPFDPRVLPNLLALARSKQARILHVHGYASADFGRLAAWRLGAALILHEHFADPKMPAYQSLADRALSGLTHRAIAVSQSTAEFLVRDRYVRRDKVRLIFNGAPLEEFQPRDPRQSSLRKQLGLGDAPLVGTIGRLNTQKGHKYLLSAARQVLLRRKDVLFLIVGDGDLETELRQTARDLGISEHVVFAGHRTDIPNILSALEVLCLPSIYEGTPLTLFEGMAAAKAIVSTAVDGCGEVLEDGKTALLVPARDPDALAGALLRVLEDPDLRKSLGAAAREASTRYDIGACVAQMQALYDEVLGHA